MNRRESSVIYHLWAALKLSRSRQLRDTIRKLLKGSTEKIWTINGGGTIVVKLRVTEGEITGVEFEHPVKSRRILETLRPGREFSYAIDLLKVAGEQITVIAT